jgi:hypothetical protein
MRRLILALSLLMVSLGACLEFDAQEITFRYDEAADRIDMLVVYRGLFAEGGNGSTNEPLQKAIKDLAEARESGEAAFWSNWPLTFELTRDYVPPVKALLAHVDVENGALFTDPKGALCAYQFVRVREAKAFLQKANTLLELGLQGALAAGLSTYGGKHQFDDDTKEIVRDFLRTGQKLLKVEAGRVELRLPMSAKDHAWAKSVLEMHFAANMPRELLRKSVTASRRAGGGDVTDTSIAEASVQLQGDQLAPEIRRSPSYRLFWDNDWAMQREPELTTVSLGVRGSKELRVVKSAEGLYHDRLLNALRERKEEIEDGLPEQEITRRFEAFHGRDAKLPPKVAAMRDKTGSHQHGSAK